MRSIRVLGYALVSALALAGCNAEKPAAVMNVSNSQMQVYVSPAVTGEAATIRIRTQGDAGPQIVAAKYDMPEMPMSVPERVAIQKSSAHSYESSPIRFSMGGTWRVTLVAQQGAGQIDLKPFDVDVR